MNGVYWRLDSFSFNPPKNWEDVVEEANKIIEAYAYDNKNEEDVKRYSEQIWEDFCDTDSVGNVVAIW